ncbi:hypothetical protein [Halalkalibaculum roseum]|nr:hypothetical protein [Halalkalibaculum roseum]
MMRHYKYIITRLWLNGHRTGRTVTLSLVRISPNGNAQFPFIAGNG